jgi:hypothetical protein
VNTDERQLSEMLHRLTPEPPRPVTVEDVASRLASQPGRGPRLRRASRGRPRLGRGWVPALAALSVFAVAGTSAGIAEVLSSHHGPSAGAGGVVSPSSASPSGSVSSSAGASSTDEPAMSPQPIAGGPWGAELINRQKHQQFTPGSLAAAPGSLYAIRGGFLVRLFSVTGSLLIQSPHSPALTYRPVVAGDMVWTVEGYSAGAVRLTGHEGQTLAPVAPVTVPVSGQLSDNAAGVLAAGPGGYLYVAAGNAVAVVNPATKRVVKTISVSAGPVNSVAISPDGRKLYVSVGSLQLLTYNPATGAQIASSGIADLTSIAGNLVATSGGVWGTAGVGMSEWTWFAPGGEMTQMIRVTEGTGDGPNSAPTLSGGAVWIGGQRTLMCADPATGQIRASATIPTDKGVVEHFGSVVVTGGQGYALYLDQAANRSGVVRFTPPAACLG